MIKNRIESEKIFTFNAYELKIKFIYIVLMTSPYNLQPENFILYSKQQNKSQFKCKPFVGNTVTNFKLKMSQLI